MTYEYVKVEISKKEKKQLRIEAMEKNVSFQKLLGSILRQYLVKRVLQEPSFSLENCTRLVVYK